MTEISKQIEKFVKVCEEIVPRRKLDKDSESIVKILIYTAGWEMSQEPKFINYNIK